MSQPQSRALSIPLKNKAIFELFTYLQTSVADPDLPDPHVFGLSGSGSVSGFFYYHAIIVRKTLIPTIL
jgi:hypothetical protein